MRSRLAWLVAAAMALVLVGFEVPLAVLVRSVAADRAVTGATAEVQSLTALVVTADPNALRLAVDQLNATAGHGVSVFLPDGTVLGAPATRDPAVELAARGRSITVEVPDGRVILVAVQGLPAGTTVIRAFVGDEELRRGVLRAWLILGLIGLALLGLGVAVADRLARSLTRPITELARVSRRLAAGDLEARAGAGAVGTGSTGPAEVRELTAGLNQLAGRIQQLVRQEREAVADLSHRLRTPLTALRLEAEGLRDPDEAGRVGVLLGTLEKAVDGLIEDARRPGSRPGVADATRVLTERAAFWAVLAEDQDRAMRAELVSGPLPVAVAEADLAACVDALLGNVFAHTPDGTELAIRLVARSGGGAVVVVEDAGPGFAVADALVRGASGAGSTGLGLDIARQTARASGGGLTVGTSARYGGARVTVEFGPA